MPDLPMSPAQAYPLLVHAVSGQAAQPVTSQHLSRLAGDLPGAEQRIANQKVLGTDYSVDDPNDLTQAGWGILFPSDVDPAIVDRLQPLIALRKSQVQDERLFQVFAGERGVFPGQSAAAWAQQRGVSLTAPVSPYEGGVPYYLLIVGSPDRISFEFQALLKMQWAVGRLAFDDVDDYGRYAEAVVAYEAPSFKPVQSRSAALWVTRNPGDIATAMLSGILAQDFLSTANALGARSGFRLHAFTNEQATKQQLIALLRGQIAGGPPAVLFTGSHGCDYFGAEPALLRRLQGALVTQEWVPGTPAGADNQFSVDDIPLDATLHGAFAFMFACYSGGCPAVNSYYLNKDGSEITIAPTPMVARLAQGLLARGMLAIIAHVDLAFPFAFQNVNGTPQVQAIRTPLELLMKGKRAGLAADSLSVLWSSLSSQLGLAQGRAGAAQIPTGQAPAAQMALAQLTIARDDARNYIVLGDPATHLRVRELK